MIHFDFSPSITGSSSFPRYFVLLYSPQIYTAKWCLSENCDAKNIAGEGLQKMASSLSYPKI
jgi:hypothetical protein